MKEMEFLFPEEFALYLRAETAKWAKVVNSAGIEPE